MTTVIRIEKWKHSSLFLALTAGLTLFVTSADESLARQKQSPVYNQCACRCTAPGDVVGSIDVYQNTTGMACGGFNNKTCNYSDPTTGGVSTGKLRDCLPYKPGGTQGMVSSPMVTRPPVFRRGIEGEQPVEPAPEGQTGSVPAQPEPVDQTGEMKSP